MNSCIYNDRLFLLGRDHGIPSYNAFRKHCGLTPLTSWSERPSELDEEIWINLKKVYEKVEDIDLYIGGVSERNVYQGEERISCKYM